MWPERARRTQLRVPAPRPLDNLTRNLGSKTQATPQRSLRLRGGDLGVCAASPGWGVGGGWAVGLVQSSWPCASVMQGHRSPPAARPAPHAGDGQLLASTLEGMVPLPQETWSGTSHAERPGEGGVAVRQEGRDPVRTSQARGSGSVQFSRSVAQSCPTLCDPVDCSMPGLPVHHQLPELAQTHVHRVSDAIQPSHPLLSPSSPTFNLSQHQGLFK